MANPIELARTTPLLVHPEVQLYRRILMRIEYGYRGFLLNSDDDGLVESDTAVFRQPKLI